MTRDRQVSPSTHLRVLRATYTGQTLETSRGALRFSGDTDLRDASWAWRWDPSPVTSLRYLDTKRKRASGLPPPLARALSLEPNNTVLFMPSRSFHQTARNGDSGKTRPGLLVSGWRGRGPRGQGKQRSHGAGDHRLLGARPGWRGERSASRASGLERPAGSPLTEGPCLPWWEMQAQGGQDHTGHMRRLPCATSRKCLSGAWAGRQHGDRPCPSPGHTAGTATPRSPPAMATQRREGQRRGGTHVDAPGWGGGPTSPGPRTKLAHPAPMSPARSRPRVKTPAHGHSAAEAATSRPGAEGRSGRPGP